MGRPSKQKQIVNQYFSKQLKKSGKLDSYECIFCLRNFAYNAWRMVKHLITCTKTTIHFKNYDLPIIKNLFKPQKTSLVETNEAEDEYFMDNTFTISKETLQKLNQSYQSKSLVSSNGNHNEIQSLKSISSIHSKSTSSLKSTKIDRFIDRYVGQGEQMEIWKLLARACYATGTPLSFTENEYFQEAFNRIRPCLQLPSRYQLSNNLLNDEHKLVKKKVHDKISSATYISIQLDGWTNIRSEPIINIVLTTPEPVVYEIIETGVNKHTGTYMASIIERIVNEVGPEKVISVVSDNAKNMVKAWDVFMSNNSSSQISFFGCAGHILNLLCKDIVNLPTFKEIQNSTKNVIKQFKYSHILNSLLKDFQEVGMKDKDKKNTIITLKLPVATRWGSESMSLESLLKNKQYLKQVAISDKAVNVLSKESTKSILDNTIFWMHVETVYSLLKPLSDWITILETEKCNVSTVVIAFNNIRNVIQEQIQNSILIKKEECLLLQKLEYRTQMAVKKIHLAGHLLDPRKKGEFLKNNESIDAAEFICNLAEHLQLNIPDIMSELAEYRSNSGLWSKAFVWDSLKTRSDETQLSPIIWWKGICSSVKISTIAIAILECSPTSASTERSFSTYGLVHTAQRNRLTND